MPVLPAAGYATPAAPTVEPLPTAPERMFDIRADAGSFGGATASALSGLGAAAEKAATSFENIHKFYEDTKVDTASNRVQLAINNEIYGDPSTGDTGFMGAQGEGIDKLYMDKRKKIDTIISEARTGIGSQYGASRFDNDIQRFRNIVYSEMGSKYDREMNALRDKTDKAKLDLSSGQMSRAANAGDVNSYSAWAKRDEEEVRAMGARNKWSPEQTQAMVETRQRDHAKEMIEAMLVKDPIMAQAMIERNKDLLRDHYPDLAARAEGPAKKQMGEEIANGTFKPRNPYDLRASGASVDSSGLVRGGALQTRLEQEAAKANLDPTMLKTFADIESSMGTDLGVRGNIFQLGKKEWAAAGGGTRGDVDTDLRNGIFDITNRKKELTAALGREPAPWELYLAHQQGVPGAIALLNNPNMPAGETVGSSENISGNRGDPNAPASQFVQHIKEVYESKARRYSGSSTAPAQAPASAGADTKEEKIYVGGDSLSSHMVRYGGAGGKEDRTKVRSYRPGDTAVAGWGPQQLLDTVIPGIPKEMIEGKVFGWSSGMSNSEDIDGDLQVVSAQIDALKARNPKALVLLGVGPADKLKGVNEKLAKLAADKDIPFAGPQRAPNPKDPEKLHSADQKAEMAAIREALGKVPTAKPVTPPGTAKTPETPNPKVDALVSTVPPREDGQPPDDSVPGLQQAITDRAAKMPADAPRGVWDEVVKNLRRTYGAAHTDQQRAHQMQQQADVEADNKLKAAYIQRLGTDNPPTATEITQDKRWRNSDQAMHTASFVSTALKPPPGESLTKHNTADLYRRMTDTSVSESERITSFEQVEKAYTSNDETKRIGKEDLEWLQKKWDGLREAKQKDVHDRTERIWKAEVLHRVRPNAGMPPGTEAYIDSQDEAAGRMSSGRREMLWRSKVDQAIAGSKDESLHDLFDPRPGNTKYIGSPEFMKDALPPERPITGKPAGGPVDYTNFESIAAKHNGLKTPQDREAARNAVVVAWRHGVFGTGADVEPRVKEMLNRLGARQAAPSVPVPMAH